MQPKLTVEELLLDDSFIDYCLNDDSPHRSKWDLLRPSHPEQAKLMEEAQELLHVLGPQLTASEVAAEVEKFRQQFVVPEHVELPPNRNRKRMRRVLVASGIAGCIALITFFAWPAPGKSSAPLAVYEHNTGFGERKQWQLPDGSTVILNSNSSLSYKEDFNQEDRQLELSGEAYFEVAKDPSKKFIVHSKGFSTTAIGTAFYVHGRQAAQAYSVNLIEGKVSLQNGAGQPFFAFCRRSRQLVGQR